jgi:hypothetical protein
LISKDGTEVLQHFTTENSPLPDNNILSIGIEPTDGDVFFFTKALDYYSIRLLQKYSKNIQPLDSIQNKLDHHHHHHHLKQQKYMVSQQRELQTTGVCLLENLEW